ncbi:MAG: hypothetical protein QOI31_1399 [Solirubrobacterales bacterium]|jgi:hypothetical protein|nr:hypothetical protein [Solirubrobacterales bacterium]
MRVRGGTLWAALAAAAIAIGGCGSDDDEPADSGSTGAQGASGAESASADITAEEFLVKLLPEKEVAIEAVVATEPECEGLKVEPSLVLVISDAASNADPDTPLTELVTEEC